jgi:hypothetical protein
MSVPPFVALSPISNARSRGQSASIVPPARLIAQSVPETFGIAAPLPDFNVRCQAKQSTAPVGSSPCVRVVESEISRLRQSLRHTSCHFTPNLLGAQYPDGSPRNWLDVGGDALFDPMMTILDRRKAEMNHFVSAQSLRRSASVACRPTDILQCAPPSPKLTPLEMPPCWEAVM